MHQPQYRDAFTGQYVLPWTYLHAIKDYTDMAAHLEANPAARAVVNFTPVLIEQLEEIAARVGEHLARGAPLPDPVLALLGPEPVPAEPAARLELLRACLRAQRKQMIERFGPTSSLPRSPRRSPPPSASPTPPTSSSTTSPSGITSHGSARPCAAPTRFVSILTERGRDFSAAQRRELLALIGALVPQILPRYRKLCRAGAVRAVGDPLRAPDHPAAARFRRRATPCPPCRCRTRRVSRRRGARAVAHAGAMRVFTRAFGTRPAGCWPSEGAISGAALELLDRAGFKWAATSANVLQGALTRAEPQVRPRFRRLQSALLSAWRQDGRVLPRRHPLRPHRQFRGNVMSNCQMPLVLLFALATQRTHSAYCPAKKCPGHAFWRGA